MNLSSVFAHLSRLSSVASGNAKLDYLKLNAGDADLKEFFRLCLDSRHNFYLTAPDPMPTPGGLVHITDDAFDCFSSRMLTGNLAKDHLNALLTTLTAEAQEVVRRILERDPRCGVSSTVNKVWPGLAFEYDLMKGESLNDYPVGKTYDCVWSGKKKKVISRVGRRASGKLDGRRSEAQRQGDTFQFLSSSGKPVNLGDKAIPELLMFDIPDGWYIDSELCDSDWNASMSVTASGNKSDTWSLQVFGIWSPDERWGRVKTSHAEMEERMKRILGTGTKHVFLAPDLGIATSEAEADAIQEKAFAMGLEGVMWKEMEAPYLARRSQAWLKGKAEETIDVQIVEVVEGEKGKKYEGTAGSLFVEDADGIRFHVGIGKDGFLSDAKRKELWDMRYILPGTYVEVLQDKVVDKKRIVSRFPRLVRIRFDK